MPTKKICFALLVHNERKMVKQLIKNIKYYCPNSSIVLYNGGTDPDLVKNLGVPVCPTSKPLQYGNLAPFFIETMEWLTEIGHDFDYFINLDSDVLFFRHGYEEFIEEQMSSADYMAVRLRIPSKKSYVGGQFSKDKNNWKHFFSVDPFYLVFNVGQVMSKKLVEAFVHYEHKKAFKKALDKSKVFAIEEVVFVNLANQLNFKIKTYPAENASTIRYRPYLVQEELEECIHQNTPVFLCHPVHRESSDPARQFIYELQNKQ